MMNQMSRYPSVRLILCSYPPSVFIVSERGYRSNRKQRWHLRESERCVREGGHSMNMQSVASLDLHLITIRPRVPALFCGYLVTHICASGGTTELNATVVSMSPKPLHERCLSHKNRCFTHEPEVVSSLPVPEEGSSLGISNRHVVLDHAAQRLALIADAFPECRRLQAQTGVRTARGTGPQPLPVRARSHVRRVRQDKPPEAAWLYRLVHHTSYASILSLLISVGEVKRQKTPGDLQAKERPASVAVFPHVLPILTTVGGVSPAIFCGGLPSPSGAR